MVENRIRWAPLPLRLFIGGSFILAGLTKLLPPGGLGYQNIVQEFTAFGIPAPEVMGWIDGLFEFGVGLALVVGVLVRLVAVINILFMAGLIFAGIIRGGLPSPLPGLEIFPYRLPDYYLSAFIIAGLLSLLISGAGAYAVDGVLAVRRSEKKKW